MVDNLDDYIIEEEDGEEFLVESLPEESTEETTEETTEEKEARKRDYLRKQLIKDEFTKEEVQARRLATQLTDEEFGDGNDWIKVGDFVDKMKNEHGVGVSVVVEAFGGDRGMYPAAHEKLEYVWHGRTRYFPADVDIPEVHALLIARQAQKSAKRIKKVSEVGDIPDELTEEFLKTQTKPQLVVIFQKFNPEAEALAVFGKMKKAEQIASILEVQAQIP